MVAISKHQPPLRRYTVLLYITSQGRRIFCTIHNRLEFDSARSQIETENRDFFNRSGLEIKSVLNLTDTALDRAALLERLPMAAHFSEN